MKDVRQGNHTAFKVRCSGHCLGDTVLRWFTLQKRLTRRRYVMALPHVQQLQALVSCKPSLSFNSLIQAAKSVHHTDVLQGLQLPL